MADQCGHRIMAITSAFQADDAGSIPADRSRLDAVMQFAFFVQTPPSDQRIAQACHFLHVTTIYRDINIGYHHETLVEHSNA